MDVIIKLKDCNIVKIDSEMKNEASSGWTWNGETSILVTKEFRYEDITFILDKDCRNAVHIHIYLTGDESNFTRIVEFFYNKDFSNVSANEFITDFCDHVDGCVYNLEDVGVYYGGWFEYVHKK